MRIVWQPRKNTVPENRRFLGGPRWYEESEGGPTREFGPNLPSGGADMCRFPGLKKSSLAKKIPNKILKVHVGKIAKTKNKLWLRVTQLESQPQISDHQKRKNVKPIAAASYATPKQRATLSHKDTRDVTPHATLARGLKFLTTKNCLSSWSEVTNAKLESRT